MCGTNASIVDNSISDDVVNAGAAANPDISASDMVEVHLLELPDVVQDTFSTSAEHDRMNLLQQTAVERIIQEMTSATEHNEQQEMLTTAGDSSSVPALPTLQSVAENATSQESAKPSAAQQPLSLTTKAEILADVRAGKLSKAEIVYKYHIRWAVLYEVIKGASEIDAELEHLGLAPEKVVEEAKGSPEAPRAEGSQGKASASYKVIFLSEDQYMKPPKKRNHMPGYKPPKRGKALIIQSTPTVNAEMNSGQIGVAVPMNTPVAVQETGYGARVKILRPMQAELQAASTQTESSSGKGSLMTFLSTTDGAHAMTQVNHRRQADKGSGTGTQNSQELPTDLKPGGYCEGVLSTEALQHSPIGNDINAALAKDEAVCWPSAPSSSQPDPAVSPASAESLVFSLSKVKEEVVEDSDTKEVVFDPFVVVKQEPCSPVGGDCDEFAVERNIQHSEQIFQSFAQAVTGTASQWDNVIVKCEPSSP